MRIAIEGCAHGDLDPIYSTMQFIENRDGIKFDMLICCGDFQAVRNQHDMQHLACPPKYRDMKDFHRYYSGERKAPYLTLFVGGNHEACNHLWELYNGGWVCPNIYYLGDAGVVNYKGYRFGGISGIYKQYHYNKGHFEKPPYSDNDIRSAYHVREYEVFRLSQLQQPVDVFVSHDWPRGIARFGDMQGLFRKKSFLKDEILNNSLGSVAGEVLLPKIQPSYWFSAHLHCKYPAIVRHQGNNATRFLALDKCLPGRDFLQVLDLPDKEGAPEGLQHDAEWLSIVRKTLPLFSASSGVVRLPRGDSTGKSMQHLATEVDMAWIRGRFTGEGMPVAHNWEQNVPMNGQSFEPRPNIQRSAFYELIDLQDPLAPGKRRLEPPVEAPLGAVSNPDEICLNDDDSEGDDAKGSANTEEDIRWTGNPAPGASRGMGGLNLPAPKAGLGFMNLPPPVKSIPVGDNPDAIDIDDDDE